MNLERRSFLKLFCLVGSQALIPATFLAAGNNADASAGQDEDPARASIELLGYSLYNYSLLVNDIEDAFVAELAAQFELTRYQAQILRSQALDAITGGSKDSSPFDVIPPPLASGPSTLLNALKEGTYANPHFAAFFERGVDAINGASVTSTLHVPVKPTPTPHGQGLRESIMGGSAALLHAGRSDINDDEFASYKTNGLGYLDTAMRQLSEFDAIGSQTLTALANNLRNALRAVAFVARQIAPGVEFVSAHADQTAMAGRQAAERFAACGRIYAVLEGRIQPPTRWVVDMALALCVPPMLWPGMKSSDREELLAVLLRKVPNLPDARAAAKDLDALAITVPG